MHLISLNIINWLEQHQLPCIFKSIFHVDCPGCGFQRSAIALLRGDIVGSWKMYPALIPMLIFFLYLIADRKFHFKRSTFFTRLGIASVFIIILASYIIKLTFQTN
jgi:hypothetical protein